jgi:hypothetical protein
MPAAENFRQKSRVDFKHGGILEKDSSETYRTISKKRRLMRKRPKFDTAAVSSTTTTKEQTSSTKNPLRNEASPLISPATLVKGVSVNDLTYVDKIHHTEEAVRVVVSLDTAILQYYALYNQDTDGLCQGYLIGVNDVFFSHEFRNDETAGVQAKRKGWPLKIREHIDSLNPYEVTSVSRSVVKENAFVSEPGMLVAAFEIMDMVLTYGVTDDPRILNTIQKRLEDIDKKITKKYPIPTPNTAILSMIKGASDITLSSTIQALKELEVNFFHLQNEPLDTHQ